jgi:CheY-like chemotaxis protein
MRKPSKPPLVKSHLCHERVPDLILLDLMMPGTDGYQVCKAIKQNTATKHIPVIFITAQTERAFEAMIALAATARHEFDHSGK